MAFYKKMTKKSLTSEMDKSVKRMLKLIEEEGDSFAKKAEMYYQKRPVLISHVEEFYFMYRSLAERYDQLSGELRKNVSSDLQSQSSGISDNGVESAIPSVINKRFSRRKSGPQAAGFEFFLGAGSGSSAPSRNESEESASSPSSSESDSDSEDESSKNNSVGAPLNSDETMLRRRIIEMEVELREMKEKLKASEGDSSKSLSETTDEGLLDKLKLYEKELKVANGRVIQLAEEKVERLKFELKELLERQEKEQQLAILEAEGLKKIEALEEELSVKNEKLRIAEEEIEKIMLEIEKNEALIAANATLEVQLESAQTEILELKEKMVSFEDLNKSLDSQVLQYETLMAEKKELSATVDALKAEAERIHQMDEACKVAAERVKELEEEVEVQRVMITDGAEEKREAIRQLCFSLDHYRNGYHQLRQVCLVHKRLTAMSAASS